MRYCNGNSVGAVAGFRDRFCTGVNYTLRSEF